MFGIIPSVVFPGVSELSLLFSPSPLQGKREGVMVVKKLDKKWVVAADQVIGMLISSVSLLITLRDIIGLNSRTKALHDIAGINYIINLLRHIIGL